MDEKKELGFRNNISKICELLEDVSTKVDNTCSEQDQINKRIDDISSVVMDLEAQCNQNFTRTGQMATICMELNSGMPSDSNNTSSKEVIKSCGEICHNCTNCSKLRKDLSSMQLSLFSMEQVNAASFNNLISSSVGASFLEDFFVSPIEGDFTSTVIFASLFSLLETDDIDRT